MFRASTWLYRSRCWQSDTTLQKSRTEPEKRRPPSLFVPFEVWTYFVCRCRNWFFFTQNLVWKSVRLFFAGVGDCRQLRNRRFGTLSSSPREKLVSVGRELSASGSNDEVEDWSKNMPFVITQVRIVSKKTPTLVQRIPIKQMIPGWTSSKYVNHDDSTKSVRTSRRL